MNSYQPTRPSPIMPYAQRGGMPANPKAGNVFSSLAKHVANGVHTDVAYLSKGLHWTFPHNPAAHFGAQMKQTGHEAVQMFNPTTKAGLLNVLSMFAGGPKGEDILGKYQPAGEFVPYSHTTGTGTDRGLMFENNRVGEPGRGMRGIMRRAQGVGGYKQANPMDVIEAQRAELVKRLATRDEIKNFSNRSSRSQMIHRELGNKMGGSTLVPGGGQPMRDYIDSLSADGVPRAYKNGLAAYNDGNNPLLAMLHEMLFGGAEGFIRKPAPPSGGYPYGGGPFG